MDGTVSSSYPDEDVTVETTYNSDSAVATLVAKNPTTGDQTTKYVYGTTLADSSIARADLLRAVIYPDSDDATTPLGDGADGIYDRVEYKYNRQGQRTDAKDQNGSVHQYDFDKRGRLLHDRVTTLATGVDGAVRRLSREYEVRGMMGRAVSYDNATVGSGSVVNDVVFEFDSLRRPAKEYQEHSGAKGANTLYVGYNFDTTASGGFYTNGARPTSVRYPNGRLVHVDYGTSGGTSDVIHRFDAIKDNNGGSPGNTLAAYSYLGLGRIVQVDYQEPDVRYDLAFGAGNDPLDGLDRFDRVVDLVWRNYGNSTDAVRIKHGYDRAGNRLWREDPVATTNSKNVDELYSYDGIYQLKSLDRGDLNANHDALTGGTKNFAESWSLDMTGNWSGYKKDDDGNGTWELDQARAHNAANEISQIAGTSTHVAHDRAGNMTKTPKPTDWSAHYDLTYDAWNRLVKVMDGQTTVATYAYDARNFRVSKTASGTTRHYYYNRAWQCIEERLGSATAADRQFIWGLRYIDDLILRDRNADSNVNTGSLGLASSGLEERLYALQDPNWNVVAITNTTGTAQERFTYDAYGKSTTWTGTFGTHASSSYEWEHRYTGRAFDSESGLYHYRNRPLNVNVGRFLSRDPIGYDAADPNLYGYVADRPTIAMDPNGLASLITGPCDIWIFVGHVIWDVFGMDPAAQTFLRAYNVPSTIVTGCGNYLGLVGCHASWLNDGPSVSGPTIYPPWALIPQGRQIPGFPPIDGNLNAPDVWGKLQNGLQSARALQTTLCANRLNFRDDGQPQRYACGASMQRCDTVTIHVKCDPDTAWMMKTHKYRQRLNPTGPVLYILDVPGLPPDSASICSLKEVKPCCPK